MSRRMWVLAAAAWVAVVIAGSAVTWLAIDRAGQQVNDPGSPTQLANVSTLGPPPASSAPSRSPSATASRPSATPKGPTAPPAPTSAHTSGTSSSPTVTSETRTWSGAAGSVTVSCAGRVATNKGASPNDGWHVEQADDPGDDIEVKFERSNSEVKVRATCVNGVPRFEVESGGDD